MMLQHRLEITIKEGTKETGTSTLCEFGAPTGSGGYSAIAKSVGMLCGVAVEQILDNIISDKGILAPMSSKINGPSIKELKEKYGIECRKKSLWEDIRGLVTSKVVYPWIACRHHRIMKKAFERKRSR